jgi:hypothetical protein
MSEYQLTSEVSTYSQPEYYDLEGFGFLQSQLIDIFNQSEVSTAPNICAPKYMTSTPQPTNASKLNAMLVGSLCIASGLKYSIALVIAPTAHNATAVYIHMPGFVGAR